MENLCVCVREVEVVGTVVAEVEAGPSEVATAVSNDLVPYLLSGTA